MHMPNIPFNNTNSEYIRQSCLRGLHGLAFPLNTLPPPASFSAAVAVVFVLVFHLHTRVHYIYFMDLTQNIFGSPTFYLQVERDIDQLPAEAVPRLRDSLLQVKIYPLFPSLDSATHIPHHK